MSNLKEALAQDFIFLHGDKKYSKEHQFIACERSRNETHVIIGYAYRWFSDAKTTISQYAIPISDWENTEKFITFNDYVKENLTTGEKYNLHNINYNLSIDAFFIEHLEDSMSTINERNNRKNPPYACCDKEVNYSDDDFMEIYDEHKITNVMTAKLIVSVKEVNGIVQVVYYCKERRRIYRKSFADTVREFSDAYRKANKK